RSSHAPGRTCAAEVTWRRTTYRRAAASTGSIFHASSVKTAGRLEIRFGRKEPANQRHAGRRIGTGKRPRRGRRACWSGPRGDVCEQPNVAASNTGQFLFTINAALNYDHLNVGRDRPTDQSRQGPRAEDEN